MNTETAQRNIIASNLLWQAWQELAVRDNLPEQCRPTTRNEGYAIQSHIEARSSHALFGWKIAATSSAGQRHIGVAGPMAGRLLAEWVVPAGARLDMRGNRMRLAECEFAFTMGRDLPPRASAYTRSEVMAAVKSLHPAIEIPDSRFERVDAVGEAQLIADCACAYRFMLGAATTCNWRAMDLSSVAVTGRLSSVAGGAPEYHHGIGREVLGGPCNALTWLANELSHQGVVLRAGQVVTTGTCVKPIPVAVGAHLKADFGAIGELSAAFD